MARTGRKPTLKTLQEKITKQQNVLAKSKIKYEQDKAELAQLLKLRNELQKDELMEAVVKSNRSYEEILAFIYGQKSVD